MEKCKGGRLVDHACSEQPMPSERYGLMPFLSTALCLERGAEFVAPTKQDNILFRSI